MNKMNIPWPGKNDKVFANGVLGPTQAYLETFKYLFNDIPIADGFKEAADVIVDYLATGKHTGYPDRLFFPVVYLYRHALELALKDIVKDGIELGIIKHTNSVKKMLTDHDLKRLWGKARKILEYIWPHGDPVDLTAAENIVLQFHGLAKSGQELRYATNKKGRPNLQNAPSHVDLAELKKVAAGLFSFLDGCSNGLGEAKDCQGNY